MSEEVPEVPKMELPPDMLDLPPDIQNYMMKLMEHKIFLTEDEIEQYKEAFLEYDKDGSGNISIKELGTVMRSLGENPTEDELQTLINKFDEDGNGEIEFTEFLVMMANKMKEAEDSELNDFIPECFRAFIDDKSGEKPLKECTISIDHFRFIMQSLPKADDQTRAEMNQLVDEMVNAVDDGDGQIDFDEFASMIKKY